SCYGACALGTAQKWRWTASKRNGTVYGRLTTDYCGNPGGTMAELMLINGELCASATGETFEVQDPGTEEIIGHAPLGNAEDARRAIAAANDAFRSWRKVGAHDRAHMLHEVAAKIRIQTEKLATLMTREGGKPLTENRDELGWVAACFDYYAELQRNTRGRVI